MTAKIYMSARCLLLGKFGFLNVCINVLLGLRGALKKLLLGLDRP